MNKKLLFFITLASFLIRLINYQHPPLLWDEASIGYNAFSILQTGRDEYGQLLPIIFKSFGDYKPGFYIYLTVPFIAIFGLNELSVRLPSIIAGSLLPLLFYFLIKKLYPNHPRWATISSLLLAFNPWNIHFSRGAWETNLLLFQLVLASLLFFHRRYFLSSLVLSSGLYTYQAAKFFSPFLILLLPLISRQFKIKFFVPFFLLSIPLVFSFFFGQDSRRLQVMSLYSYQRPQPEVTQIISESSLLDYQLLHSHPLFFLKNVLTRYFNYFSPELLMFIGDWQTSRHSAPYIGLLLYPTYLFFIVGFCRLIPNFKQHLFFLFLLIFTPLPASLSRDIVSPVRSLYLSLPLIFFASVGFDYFISKFPKFLPLFIFVFFASFILYLDLYFNHLTKVKPAEWLVGYRQAVEYVVKHGDNRQVFFTPFYGQPYIYYLFYSQYPPSKYQPQAKLIENGVDTGTISQVDNLSFSEVNISQLQSLSSKILAIISYDEIVRQGQNPADFLKLSPLFYVYQN